MNSLFTLKIENKDGVWLFDDKSRNIFGEPFVAGSDTLLHKMNERLGFPNILIVIFSSIAFPDHDLRLNKQARQDQKDGYWYYCPQFNLDCWLCPTIHSYFKEEEPETLFLKFNRVVEAT